MVGCSMAAGMLLLAAALLLTHRRRRSTPAGFAKQHDEVAWKPNSVEHTNETMAYDSRGHLPSKGGAASVVVPVVCVSYDLSHACEMLWPVRVAHV